MRPLVSNNFNLLKVELFGLYNNKPLGWFMQDYVLDKQFRKRADGAVFSGRGEVYSWWMSTGSMWMFSIVVDVNSSHLVEINTWQFLLYLYSTDSKLGLMIATLLVHGHHQFWHEVSSSSSSSSSLQRWCSPLWRSRWNLLHRACRPQRRSWCSSRRRWRRRRWWWDSSSSCVHWLRWRWW